MIIFDNAMVFFGCNSLKLWLNHSNDFGGRIGESGYGWQNITQWMNETSIRIRSIDSGVLENRGYRFFREAQSVGWAANSDVIGGRPASTCNHFCGTVLEGIVSKSAGWTTNILRQSCLENRVGKLQRCWLVCATATDVDMIHRLLGLSLPKLILLARGTSQCEYQLW